MRNWPDVTKWRIFAIILGIFVPFVAIVTLIFFRSDEIYWLLWGKITDLETTYGYVVRSEIQFRGKGNRNSAGWHFLIEYEYKIKGILYRSNRVNYAYTGDSDKGLAQSYVIKYPKGKKVTVYYDPMQPEAAVLEPDEKDYQFWYVILGSVILGLFIASLAFFISPTDAT